MKRAYQAGPGSFEAGAVRSLLLFGQATERSGPRLLAVRVAVVILWLPALVGRVVAVSLRPVPGLGLSLALLAATASGRAVGLLCTDVGRTVPVAGRPAVQQPLVHVLGLLTTLLALGLSLLLSLLALLTPLAGLLL